MTDSAGVRGIGYAMGAAAADYDNDGHVDLFVAGVRQNQLLRNRRRRHGSRTSPHRSGIASGDWAVAAGWFDYDNDGLSGSAGRQLREVVCRTPTAPAAIRIAGLPIYCHPRAFQGLPNRLYRNRGDGTFEDVSARAGLLDHIGKGMSVAFADYDHDGRLDVFVTNDTVPNFLFHNKGDGTFEETALLAGVSRCPDSGRASLEHGHRLPGLRQRWVGGHARHGARRRNVSALPERRPRRVRRDDASERARGRHGRRPRAGARSSPTSTTTAGRTSSPPTRTSNDRIGDFQSIQWKQPNSLFINGGQGDNGNRGRFRDATAEAGFAGDVAVHRGCGVADFDGDGRLDFVVLVIGGQAELWQNETASDHHWLIVRLIGTKSNRDGIGARVTIGSQVRTMTTSIGYASSSHAGLHFGLGTAADPVTVEVQWPSGIKQTVESVKTNQVVEIKEK